MNRSLAVDDRAWAASPCSSCPASPCCTHLPLYRFHVETRSDFEWARGLLRHPRIELGLYESGWWMAYYLSPCRFLNPLDSKCLIHGTARQPAICKSYSAMRCWYKRAFTGGGTSDFLRFNEARLDGLSTMIAFDGAGELSSVPDWELIDEALAAHPLEAWPPVTGARAAGGALLPAPVDSQPAPAHPLPVPPAPVAPALIFPLRTPRTRGDLDVVRFRLGFHGVRIGVHAADWVTLLGDPPGASRYLLFDYARFEGFLASVTYDAAGAIVQMPDFELPAAAPF